MKRQLASKLVLVVKQQSVARGSSSGWTFPHARHESGETMRATAERALRECIGVSQVRGEMMGYNTWGKGVGARQAGGGEEVGKKGGRGGEGRG